MQADSHETRADQLVCPNRHVVFRRVANFTTRMEDFHSEFHHSIRRKEEKASLSALRIANGW